MAKSFRAVYRDTEGRTYSAHVEIRDGKWQMKTSDGFVPIIHNFQDDVGGLLTFVEYREEADTRVHVEQGSSWADHQQAFFDQQIAQQRQARDQARTEIQNVPVDPTKVASARTANEYAAAIKRPRGGGVGVLVDGPTVTQAEIEAALRNRR
jgi:hypothetical protein